ncbi:MAG TPA: hypothetical protein VEY13_07515 [Rubrobacteraceae bacterium]|nr:hypothetical protein [Rubrobacteraceae bacterium]
MQSSGRHIRKPVKRGDAEQYLVITLLGFAASVILIRLFLDLTGYPQVGGSELHIAHALWGGLLLFVASLLPLVFANRWVYKAGALLAGVGVGLFIDEVGKFITQKNDYFYPAAAPIIYAFFLFTVLIYLQVRRPRSSDARAELYHAFNKFEEVLDRDLDARERADLKERLRRVNSQAAHPDIAHLANTLREFLASDALSLAPYSPNAGARWLRRVRAYGSRLITARRLKVALVSGLILLGLEGLVFSLVFIVALIMMLRLVPSTDLYLDFDLPSGSVAVADSVSITDLSFGNLVGILAMLGLGGVVGLLLMIAATLLAIGSEQRGSSLGYLGLLLSLTAVAPINFYFSQFAAVIGALVQFALLMAVILYRRRYLVPEPGSELPEGGRHLDEAAGSDALAEAAKTDPMAANKAKDKLEEDR